MVRTTRSTTALQNQQTTALVEQPLPSTKKSTRKRKRSSVLPTESEGQRATKQRRGEVKEVGDGERPGVGDLPLNLEDAAKILDILEMVDTQGLLDRVFPLPETDESSTTEPGSSKDVEKMYSLRALLTDPSSHPLRVIRSAIHPLFPITSHPRTKPSIPVAQQLYFCKLALSLLDQSSKNHPIISLSESTIFSISQDVDPSSKNIAVSGRKFTLVQRLPGGDWWTSANSTREGETSLSPSEAKNLQKGQAELVSVIPSLPIPVSNLPTLGELQMDTRKEARLKFKPLYMHPRPLSSGTFLDYGSYTSFAPAFDSEGAEIGRDSLGQILMGRIDKKKIQDLRRKLLNRQQIEQEDRQNRRAMDVDTMQWHDQLPSSLDEIFTSLFPGSQVDGLIGALRLLQVEEGVASLLEKNAEALERLILLQTVRLKDGNPPVREDSEEWNLANEILNSLTLLAALRPRTESLGDNVPLKPPLSVLRALHSALPSAPGSGWAGNLDESRKTALRDDTTVHVKAGAAVTTQPSTTVVPHSSQTNYSANAQYRSAAPYAYHTPVVPRTTGQTPAANQSGYYPNAYLQSQSGTATPQYQYSYAQWYNYPAQVGQKSSATPYYNAYMPQTTTSRAVGNTAKPQQAQQNGWTQSFSQLPATTLPPHLRRAGTSTPGSPNPAQMYTTQYHAYVPTPQPGR